MSQRMRIMPLPFKEPIYMNLGGYVMSQNQRTHNMKLQKIGGKVKGKNVGNIDTIPTLLAVNEIVIPRRISMKPTFKRMLKKKYNYDIRTGKFKSS